ncbi:MAG TPA: chaperone modulator CbpM [Candidatus Binataceae bacterium]|nr:chaperone modulator CbpM [Candidatus Binataceae bacterium]
MARRTQSTIRRRTSRGEIVLLSRTVLCSVTGISERQLAVWEHEDLIAPARISDADGAAEPLYNRDALRRVRLIRTLAEELEVNLPGIGIILHLLDSRSR